VRSLWLWILTIHSNAKAWLGLLDSDVEPVTGLPDTPMQTAMSGNIAEQRDLAKHFRRRHDQIKVLLAEKGRAPVAVPKLDAMMKATGVRASYAHYFGAVSTLTDTLGHWAFRGEDWAAKWEGTRRRAVVSVALALCRIALLDGAGVLRRLGASAKIFRKNYVAQLQRAIDRCGA